METKIIIGTIQIIIGVLILLNENNIIDSHMSDQVPDSERRLSIKIGGYGLIIIGCIFILSSIF